MGKPAVHVDLAVTTRTGIASIQFPPTTSANLLFKVADSATGSTAAQTQIIGDQEIAGSVTSGEFCDIPGTYTLYFDVHFNRSFRTSSTWQGSHISPGARTVGGAHSGAALTFDTTHNPVVLMKVGISFVSLANARANQPQENSGWSLATIARAGRTQWNELLGHISVSGGTTTEQQTFYSAMYHSLLEPNVFSDDNGQYPGFDHKVHTATGYTQYANFSGWDIYRSEVQLLALGEPARDRRHDALAPLRLRAKWFPAEVAVRRLQQRRDQRRLRRRDPGRRVRVRCA